MVLRDVVHNDKLLSLYEILQSIGVHLRVSTLTKEEAEYGMCSVSPIDFHQKIWDLGIENNVNVPDDVFCHELMHLVMVYEGFPVVLIPNNLKGAWEYGILRFLQNMICHLEVWRLTEQYGFSETNRYSVDIANDLIPLIESSNLLNLVLDPFCRNFERALYIVNGMLCPATEDVKRNLQEAAKMVYPQEFALSQQLYSLCCSAVPLTPEAYLPLFGEIILPLQPPRESLIVEYAKDKYPNLRAKIFQNVLVE